jgi:hypothetical protein
MNLTDAWRIPVSLTFKLFCIVAFASIAAPSRGEDAAVDKLRAGIEGIYVLKEWHRNGQVLRPPLVDARTVLLNGRIMFISHYAAQEPDKTTVAGYGIFILEPGKFSYRYEGFSVVTQTANGTYVSEKAPWEGLKTFAASIENSEIRFRATNGPEEFRFNQDGLSYSDGTQKRVYRRVSDR